MSLTLSNCEQPLDMAERQWSLKHLVAAAQPRQYSTQTRLRLESCWRKQ